MEVSFKNDGAYNESAVNSPVLVNNTPIGVICVVDADTVTCEIFDLFVGKEVAIPTSTATPPKVDAVYVNGDSW